MFNFNLKDTTIYQAVKRSRFPLFSFAGFLSKLFLFLIVISLILVLASFGGVFSSRTAISYLILSIIFALFFYNLSLFLELKIKKPEIFIKIEDAITNPDEYNLADFLSFDSAKIVEDAIKFCKKRKLKNNSTALFYSAIKVSRDLSIIAFRLGINVKDLQDALKNYLEKMERQEEYSESFSDDFENTIKEAMAVSQKWNHERIDEKEILIGLARSNDLVKQILINYDLKKEDVENVTLWLDSIEDSVAKSKEFWSYENLARQGSFGKDWASGYTINLDQYSIDWRKNVSRWAFKEIVGHEKELEDVQVILAKSSMANALIIGNTGTGRKSIIEALALKCYLGKSLAELNNKRVVELDLVTLVANIEDAEKLESILDQIFSEVVMAGNVILVIDNLENFVGLKEYKPGQVDISGILSKYLAMPSFQFVGITSYEGYHKNIEENSSFAELFVKVEVQEVSELDTIKILQQAAMQAEYRTKLFIIYPSIREIVNLTGRYMPSLPFPKKALDVLDETVVYVQRLREKVLLPHHVAEVVSKKTEIPVGKMEVKEKEVLMNLENLIHQRIVSQDEAVKEISIAMRRARAGISSKTRPMGSFMFLGPTGVGKTETAKALAQIYFGNEIKMIRIDMSEFQAISDIPRLIGSTSPVEMQGLLTTPVRESPFSLVLLDEVEKAHPNILNLLLQVLDEGHITDGQGRKVVFTNTIIICTSNVGADLIFKEVESGQLINKNKLLDYIFEKNLFRPEFINRFDATIVFHPLTKNDLMQIAQLALQGLQKNLKEKEINLEITEGLKIKIVEISYKPEFGAREMRRVIQDNVENVIAGALISDTIKKGDIIEIDPDGFKLVVNSIRQE
jgi:ATP-dependent Clp protease ATP-binding subunit ClpC